MRQTRHVQDLAPLRKECSDICPRIHWPSQHIRVILRGLRLADQTAKNAGQGNGLLHGATGRSGSQSLQVERQVVLNGRTRLYRLHLESRADVGEHRGPKGQRLGVVLLPSLIFSSQVKGARVLQIRRQHNSLVAGFSRELNSEVPGIEGDEDEIEVFRSQILGSERVEAGDGIPKGTSVSDMFPRQSRQTRCEEREKQSNVSPSFRQCTASLEILKRRFRARITSARQKGQIATDEAKREGKNGRSTTLKNLLHSGVMGVLTGLTRTLSWVIYRDVVRSAIIRPRSHVWADSGAGVLVGGGF